MKLSLGLGCDRGTPLATLDVAVQQGLALLGAQPGDVGALSSITLKADEPALLALAARQGWPLRFFTPEQLAEVSVPNPSETVRRHTGTPSVSEAAALLAAQAPAGALLLEKLRVRGIDGRNVTLSIARMPE